jgi:UrcA family protein
MIRSILISALLSTAVVGAAVPCFAQEETTVSVKFADLNLSSKDGAAALERRIARAVDEVCGPADPRDLAVYLEESKCQAKAWAGARPQMAQAIATFGSGTRFASLSFSNH